MLTLKIEKGELYDEKNEEFIDIPAQTICLEHSLVSVSKWESKWHKPFLDKRYPKTQEEIIDYIRCMTITQNVNPNVYYLLSSSNINKVQAYIEDSMTATWFSDNRKTPGRSRVVTSELIYYWMVALQIPFECQKWHLNRLLTLIRVCNEENKQDGKKKRYDRDFLSNRAALNAARKSKLNSRG